MDDARYFHSFYMLYYSILRPTLVTLLRSSPADRANAPQLWAVDLHEAAAAPILVDIKLFHMQVPCAGAIRACHGNVRRAPTHPEEEVVGLGAGGLRLVKERQLAVRCAGVEAVDSIESVVILRVGVKVGEGPKDVRRRCRTGPIKREVEGSLVIEDLGVSGEFVGPWPRRAGLRRRSLLIEA